MPSDFVASEHERVRVLLADSARYLDQGRYEEYVDLFTADGKYSLEARSDEIGRDMTWLSLQKGELAALLGGVSEHVRDSAKRKHLVSVEEVVLDHSSGRALSTFVVFRTDRIGQSELYAVGTYEDELLREEGAWKLKSRKALLETRQLRVPNQIPL